jgi:hypothetical protein
VCVQGVHRGRNSAVSSKETESLRILEGSARWASSKCIGAQDPELLNVLWRRDSARRASRKCAEAQENRELFEFCI